MFGACWNGTRLGGVGNFPEGTPRALATRPTLLQVPVQGTSGEAPVATRVYLAPGMPRSGDAGGIHIAPLAEQTAGEARYVAQWMMTFVGYVVDAVRCRGHDGRPYGIELDLAGPVPPVTYA